MLSTLGPYIVILAILVMALLKPLTDEEVN